MNSDAIRDGLITEADTWDLITAMRSHEAKVMRLLDEIGTVVGEVQA